MRRIIALSFALFFILPIAYAEKKEAVRDTVNVPLLNGVAVEADLVGVVQRVLSDHGQYEAGVRINMKDKYFPVLEAGWGEADEAMTNTDTPTYCKIKAPFFRVGCDYNILRNKHDIYKVFGGGRYGFSTFDYEMTDFDAHATYHWLEAVFGIDAKIWGPLHLGWDVRYRRQLAKKYDDRGKPWYVPGFGNQNKTCFSLQFHLTFAI